MSKAEVERHLCHTLRSWLMLGVDLYIPKDLPHSHEDVESRAEVFSKWQLRELKIAQDNLASKIQLSAIMVLVYQ